jgi:hypothetical protein
MAVQRGFAVWRVDALLKYGVKSKEIRYDSGTDTVAVGPAVAPIELP